MAPIRVKGLSLIWMLRGIGSGFNHDVDLEILHGRIEVLFHNRAQPVNFVNEKHIMITQAGKQPCKITGFVEHRT